MKKHILKILLFSIIFLVVFCKLSDVLCFFAYDSEITPIEDLYGYPKNTIDVLLMGGSRIHFALNSATIWKDYGMASYSLWGIGQPMWNTYYYLKEALKTQTPKVVVLDVHYLTFDMQYDAYDSQIKNTMGLGLSLNKLKSVIASVPEGSRIDIFTGLPTYHDRNKAFEVFGNEYDPINKDVLIATRKPNLIDKHSIYCRLNRVTRHENVDMSDITGSMELAQKQEKYFMKIVKLLKKKKIPLLLITLPQPMTREDAMMYNTVAQIASENNVTFLNFNLFYDKIGFNKSTDIYEQYHFNYNGMYKITKYLEKYLKENYSIPDRRHDSNPIYKTWQIYTDGYNPAKLCGKKQYVKLN